MISSFTTNQIVDRVVAGYPKKGLIWHFQGSGKSLLMVIAALKLRMHPKLGSPTVIIVVDRIDLDTQITATFNAADVPNMLACSLNHLRWHLDMENGPIPGDVLFETDRLESQPYAGYDPYFEGDEPPGL